MKIETFSLWFYLSVVSLLRNGITNDDRRLKEHSKTFLPLWPPCRVVTTMHCEDVVPCWPATFGTVVMMCGVLPCTCWSDLGVGLAAVVLPPRSPLFPYTTLFRSAAVVLPPVVCVIVLSDLGMLMIMEEGMVHTMDCACVGVITCNEHENDKNSLSLVRINPLMHPH